MNDANRKLLEEAQDALTKLERGLTSELTTTRGGKQRSELAVEYGGVAAAKAALDTVG